MLSIVVSSYQTSYFHNFTKSVQQTIGDIAYEIIQIQNPNILSICEAYNKGAEKAQYDNLLFIHEDVEFESQNWGVELSEKLKQKHIGCIGLAGSTYTPNVPFAWWDSAENDVRNITQCDKNGNIKFTKKITEDQYTNTLDGVFLAMRKEVFKNFHFSCEIEGFHCYDINITNRINEKFKNIVSSNIMLKHYSEGSTNKSWMDALIKYRSTFKANNRGGINKKFEAYFFKCFIDHLNEFSYSEKVKKKLILQYANPKYIGWKLAISTFIKTI